MQILLFKFNAKPSQMSERLINLKVFNTKRVISGALIGSYMFSLGVVYDEVDHCFIHKWVLLCDPRNPSSGAKVAHAISLSLSLSFSFSVFVTLSQHIQFS